MRGDDARAAIELRSKVARERFLNFFHDLGSLLLGRWKATDFDSRVFPDLAVAALHENPPSAHVDPMDVIRWAHQTPLLVPQADIDSKFGQPAITVFRCERFYVDALFWVDGTTAIHQHGFSGAFHVMQGSSLQSTYRFTPRRTYGAHFMSGKLDLLHVDLLARGDIRPIVAGPALIHSLFHLDRPSVSVVIRTPSDAFAGPQYSYSRSGLAFDPFAKFEGTTRKAQILNLLHTLSHPEFEEMARAAVQTADAFEAFCLLTHLAKRIESLDKYRAFLGACLHPSQLELFDALLGHAAEEKREDYIVSRRRLAKQPEHRFFLALLMNLPDRSSVFEVMHRRSPVVEPIESVLQWLRELARLDSIHSWVRSMSKTTAAPAASCILDVALTESVLAVARSLLEGASDGATVEALGATMAPAEILNACGALRGSSLLRPLFAP
jgi:hypothetical protein